MKKIAILLVLLLIITACAKEEVQRPPQPQLPPPTGPLPSGTATTQDGQTISYQLYEGTPGGPAVILLHMLRRTRADWDSVAKWLQKNGFTVIAYDARGHGQSTGDWQTFKEEDFQKMTNDITAIKSVLESKGTDVKRIAIIGASIGANTAYNYAVQDPDIKTVILLSPGLDYRGVTIDTTRLNRPFLVVASNDDTESAKAAEEFKKNKQATIKMYEDAGHGTNMFQKNDLAPTILNWIRGKV
ncbi:alpha/beta fold hydrolase [Candidatus Woesearchaeota archaeon]|nr:alpha/beta fold hydrolase [Candidatus Woesearchaeota archaeon]MBW3016262.1 alpha/beta fold hydrolase [Candidatus Woesearchaeota archaeon]